MPGSRVDLRILPHEHRKSSRGLERSTLRGVSERRTESLCCANCGREPRDDENPDDEWRVCSDGVGELVTFCSECAEREFGVRLARE